MQADSDPNDANAEVRGYVNELNPDGSYNYQYETSNGIAVQEAGLGGNFARGSSQYYTPEGELIQLTYTADENGFHPQGSHLPKAPPIPDVILRSIEYNRLYSKENQQSQQ